MHMHATLQHVHTNVQNKVICIGMYIRSYLATGDAYLPYLPTSLPKHLPPYTQTYIHAYVHTYMDEVWFHLRSFATPASHRAAGGLLQGFMTLFLSGFDGI